MKCYLIELLPAFTGAARQLGFEHSPGRGNPKFTADHTACDAMFRYSTGQGRERGVSFDELADVAQRPDADPFDLLCHLAFNAPLRTRRERAQQLEANKPSFFARYSPEARAVLEELLEKNAEHGDAQFVLPDVLRVPPITKHGQVAEIVHLFGGVDRLRSAVTELQNQLYAT